MEETSLVDGLLALEPYDGSMGADKIFLEALQQELIFHYENNQMYRQFCNRKGFDPHRRISSLQDIPPVAVSVFKELGSRLNSVPRGELTMALQSSATSGVPSTVVLDKITARRQGKAMVKVIGEFIGHKRIPFLVMDIDPAGADRKLLGARFAAVTGYLKFAGKAEYFLKAKDGISYFDVEGIRKCVESLPLDQPVVVFGFTHILYQNVLKSIAGGNIKLNLPKGSKIIHIGGWKKLESEKIGKDLFNERLAACFGVEPVDVIDIYGFTEQMGLNYPDCRCGCKHASSYARVIVRDAVTRQPLDAGKEGVLEFITPVPHSYPGNAVMTDDIGVLENGPCPYGRAGQRFRVVGRLKKAEVRGCGDILSSKLVFDQNALPEAVEDRNLDVQFFKGKLTAADSEGKLPEIIDQLNARRAWLNEQPVEALIGLIGEAAKKWFSDTRFAILKDKGLLFLSQWCDAGHLRQIAKDGLRGDVGYMDGFKPFPVSETHLLRANARGLCGHWMAGNVQILGMFALVQCIVTKNPNLLKVAAKDGGVFSLLIRAFEGLTYTTEGGFTIKGDDLVQSIAVVYFSRNARNLGRMMSLASKVRIAWGGRAAVETVASYPSSIDSQTVIFGPKLSYAVIAKESLDSELSAKKLARRVSVDVSLFDQTGCASPHNLYIERGGEVSPERFCEILAEIFPKTEQQIPKPSISPEQASAIHSARGVYDFKGKVWGSESMSWTILLSNEETCEWCKPVYSRVLMVHEVNHINEALAHVEDFIQTIGISAPENKAIAFADAAAAKGVARFPLIGRMLNFEMPWDGMFLMDRLVKWSSLFGPLC